MKNKSREAVKAARLRAIMDRHGYAGVLFVACQLGIRSQRGSRLLLLAVGFLSCIRLGLLLSPLSHRPHVYAPQAHGRAPHPVKPSYPKAPGNAFNRAAGVALRGLLERIYRESAATHLTPAEPTRQFAALLKQGADPDIRDDMGDTPLIFCTIYGYENCVRLLLRQGADVDAIDAYGGNALMAASHHRSLCMLLLQQGGKVNQKYNNGNTALSMAAGRFEAEETPEVLQILLKAGADVNAVNAEGETALMTAASYGNTAKLRVLIRAGADTTLHNKAGRTALSIVRHQIAIGHTAYKDYRRALTFLTESGISQ